MPTRPRYRGSRFAVRAVLRVLGTGIALGTGPAPWVPGLVAQRIPVQCPDSVIPPGGSNPEDRAMHRCRLDTPPLLLDDLAGLPTPVYERQVHASLMLFVNADGHVDTEFTRYYSRSSDRQFYDSLMRTIHAWRFEPGLLAGDGVRTGFRIDIVTDTRTDTLPEALRWTLRPGLPGDTLVGHWEPTGEARAPSAADRLGALVATTRRLAHMQVLLPARLSYCLLVDDLPGDEAAGIREGVVTVLYERPGPLGAGLAPEGCERDPRFFRYRITDMRLTEGRRVVVSVAGDYLREWPPGFNGRAWRAWTARCVVPDAAANTASGGDDGTSCQVVPVSSGDPEMNGWLPFRPSSSRAAGDSVGILVEFMLNGSFRRDSVHAALAEIPDIRTAAVFDLGLGRCADVMSWLALTPERGRRIITAFLDLWTGRQLRPMLSFTEARSDMSPESFVGQRCREPADPAAPFALFFPGDIGDAPREPVTVCVDETGCTRRYRLDPGVHQLAPAPHVRFRPADMRPAALEGEYPRIQLTVDRDVEGLLPLIVIDRPARPSGWAMAATGPRTFRFAITGGDPWTNDAEFLIYLVRVPTNDSTR